MRPGDRVALAPHLDLWMRGARFGTVKQIGIEVTRENGVIVQRRYIRVKVDNVRRIRHFNPEDLTVVKT